MTIKAPGRRAFYKYTSPETALAVLKNRTVWYRTPLDFNDPFDIQSGLHFDFDIDTLHDRLLDRWHEFAVSDFEPPVLSNDVWGKIALEIRRHYPTRGFPRDDLKKLTLEGFSFLVQQIKLTRQQYQQRWQEMLPNIRVFCVSEHRDNLLMWAHYAKDHSGAVFEFWSLPEEDNALSVARPVQYVKRPPPFFSESEWLDDLTGIKALDTDALYRRYAYVKSKHWKYEREWRVWYPLANEGKYDEVPIRQSEFKALYLGCNAEPKFISDTIELTRFAFPGVRIFRGEKKTNDFALKYIEIS